MPTAHTPARSTAALVSKPRRAAVPMSHRWWITCDLTSTTPLSIGDGRRETGRIPKPDNTDKLPEHNAVARNDDGEPYIPATGIKGALRALARNVAELDTSFIQRLFGDNPTDAKGNGSRRPGAVDFHDAHFTKFADTPANAIEVALTTATAAAPATAPIEPPQPIPNKKPAIGERVDYGAPPPKQRPQQLAAAAAPQANVAPSNTTTRSASQPPIRTLRAHFDEEKKTFIETSTRIDRDRGTVDDRHLFNDERVAPGAVFTLSFFVQHTSEEAGKAVIAELLGLINLANDGGGIALGGDTGRGCGRAAFDSVTVKYFGADQLAQWQGNQFAGTWQSAAERATIAARPFTQNKTPATLALNIEFTGLYLVNEPSRTTKGENAIAHTPRLDEHGKPVLPARTLQGALRSQSERILRTLGIFCCGAGGIKSCADDATKSGGDFCLACQLYGNSKRAARVTQPVPPECTCPGSEHKQDFIAIDRFTGGGKDGAKFNAESRYQPKFKASLSVASDTSDAARGLLLLTLRDLAEGDTPLGWGKRKGYGDCTVASEPNKPFLERAALVFTKTDAGKSALEALRALPRSHACRSSLPTNLDSIFAAPPNPANATTPTNAAASTSSKSPAPALAKPATIPGVLDRFHNTYHFISIEASDVPKWASVGDFKDSEKWKTEEGIGVHSHARYANGTETAPVFSGRIECTLTAETPFIVGGERTPNTDASTTVKPYQINGALTIPASSLKGMIGSIAEAACGSAMRVMDTTSIITYRNPASAALSSVGYVFRDDAGELKVNPLSMGEHYDNVDPTTLKSVEGKQVNIRALSPPVAGVQRDIVASKYRELLIHTLPPTITKASTLVFAPEASSSCARIADERTAATLGDARKSAPLPDDDASYREWAASVTPYHLITCVKSLPKDVWQRAAGWFRRNDEAQKKTLFDQLKLRPKAGDIIYFKSSGQKITEFAYSRIWRGATPNGKRLATYADFLPHEELEPFSSRRKSISDAELLLGFVQDDGESTKTLDVPKQNSGQALAFAGKLRFHDALLHTQEIADPPVPLNILANPKPPSPSLYFTSTTGARYVRKADLSVTTNRIRGRKQYLHALGVDSGTVVPLNASDGTKSKTGLGTLPWQMTPRLSGQPDPNAKQRTHARLARAGARCDFVIDFDNLTHSELQLLVFALRPAVAFRHKLGMGKGIGLGTVRIDPLKARLVDRLKRYGAEALAAARCAVEMSPCSWQRRRRIGEIPTSRYRQKHPCLLLAIRQM